jgi:hypothetical protein
MTIRVVPLASTHRRDEFDCGEPALNDFLRRYARQQQKRDFSRTYVVLDAKNELGRDFYERRGFLSIKDARLFLLLPIATLRRGQPNDSVHLARLRGEAQPIGRD